MMGDFQDQAGGLDGLCADALQRHRQVVEGLDAAMMARVAKLWLSVLRSGGKILFCGNGGSAADAQHLATELVVRYVRNGRALPALALTTDTSALTAIGNDFGFADLFARQVEALGQKGDLLVGISTSGRSENVLRALRVARERGLTTLGLCGQDRSSMSSLCDEVYGVDCAETARIQEVHLLLGHMCCEAVEGQLRGE